MKLISKVKRQRRIRQIPGFCDNPMGKEARALQDLVKKGIISVAQNRSERKRELRLQHK